MRNWILGLVAVVGLSLIMISIGSLSSQQAQQTDSGLPDRGPGPELKNTVWLNTERPIHLADLRGQVVLLDFWTINCINCEHTIPYLKDLYARLNGQGVQIIGIHFPEFADETDPSTVRQYMQQWGIQYPVAIDNDAVTWNAYEMHAWPAFEVIDKNGERRLRWIGEGGDKTLEATIQALLAEPYRSQTADRKLHQ